MSINTIKKTDAKKKSIVLYLAIVFVIGAFVPSVSPDQTDPWWNSDWQYRKEITIDHVKVAADLIDFPVLLHFTDPDLSFKAQLDGDDIIFVSKTGNKLNHEIESYNSTSGDITAWVQIPFLSSIQDTLIYLYYGNQNCNNQQNSEGIWDTHFLAVHHLEETTGTIYDSTSNNNDGTPFGDLNQNTQGRIDGADYFDGANDHITLPQVYSTQNQFTIEAWIYPQPGARYFLSQRSTNGVFLQITDGGGYIQWYINGEKDGISGISWNTWYYIVLTYDGTTARLYKNAEVPRSKIASPAIWPSEGMYISDRSAGSRAFHGTIDEVRLSDIARDVYWINTCYNNQNYPSSFFQLGNEEIYHEPQAPIISNERPINEIKNVSIVVSYLKFNLSHPDGKLMTYTVNTIPDIINGPQIRTNISNITVYIPVTQTPLSTNTKYYWYVNATDGIKWTNQTYTFTTEESTVTDLWWDTDWWYRKAISINSTKIDSDFVNFPVLIYLIDTNLTTKVQNNGNDFTFTTKLGEKLNHEIESYNSTTGELIAWVNIPFLSSSQDTIVYLYYGNQNCNNQQNSEGTWNENFVAVHHLEETEGIINDSTSYQNNGVDDGNLNKDVIGKIDGADDFDGITSYINCGDSNSLRITGKITIEAWIKITNPEFSQYMRIASKKATWNAANGYELEYNPNLNLLTLLGSGSNWGRANGINLDINWHYIVGIINGTVAKIYVDGVDRTTDSSISSLIGGSQSLHIGKRSGAGEYFYGGIDEVRISNIVRTPSWVNTCYKNQNDPTTFFNIGDEQEFQGNGPIIFNERPTDKAINISLNPLLQVDIWDSNEDLVEWRIESNVTGSWDILNLGSLPNGNGTIDALPINMNNYNTTYWWRVYATDPGGSGAYSIRIFNFTTKTENTPPTVSNPYPSHGAINIPFNPTLTIDISDPDIDLMTIQFRTNASGNWENIGSYTNIANGRYSQQTTNMNKYFTIFWWSVNTTDQSGSGRWTNQTFSFRTIENTLPMISNVYPNNQNANYNPRLSVDIYDSLKDNLTVIFKTNISGQWETIDTYYGGNGLYTQNTQHMDIKGKIFFWSIHIFDGTGWINQTYKFTAQPFVLKWVYNTNAGTVIGPLSDDINGDGFYEVFTTGMGKISCVNGSSGALIWSYSNGEIDLHAPFEIGDLNNDGIKEIVISGNESIRGRTIALHANNGSVYWNVPVESGGKSISILDIEGNGYPYVYTCSGDFNHSENGRGRLRKLRGTDGAVLKEVFIWRPCWGGPSVADGDNDGNFEIYITDRCANYHAEGQFGKGMQCYDAKTLELLWYQDIVTCSSHCIALIDVNNDGILDAVAQNQASNNSGIYTIDGYTWDKIPGKWQNNIPYLTAHSQFSIYDIDNDGRLELFTTRNSYIRSWDLGRWALDTTLDRVEEPPRLADVIGNKSLEIIVASSSIKIYNGSSNQLIETIPSSSIASTLVQDIDNDGQNELIVITSNGILRAYDTSAYTPTPRVRTINQYYSERRLGAAVYIPPPGAPQPIIKQVLPQNGTQDVSLNPSLCARVVDFHYDRMNITISTNASGTWQDIATYNNVGNGWYNITTTNMNQLQTTYYWRVSAVDPWADTLTTTKTYHFTTHTPPIISNIVAAPPEVLSGETVNVSCQVTDYSLVNIVKVNVTSPTGQKTNMSAFGGQPRWEVLKYDNFESGWGNYTKGGPQCSLYNTNTSYIHQGNQAVKIQDFRGVNSSFYLTTGIDVDTPHYTSLKVDFWFKTQGMEDLENFWVKYYDGQHWRIVDNYIKPGAQGYLPGDKPFNNTQFYHGTTWINETKYTFPRNMKIRFECDASDITDNVYIDQIYINATKVQGSHYYYNTSYIEPGTYNYYLWAMDQFGNSMRSATYTFDVSTE